VKKLAPSFDDWLKEAKESDNTDKCGMFLMHCGVVRASAKAKVRSGDDSVPPVKGMVFSYDQSKVDAAVEAAKALSGIFCVKVWLNSGELKTGDDIMRVLVGGDIRPNVTEALQYLVGRLKTECVSEYELYL